MDRAGQATMVLVLASILLAASSLHGHAAAAGQKSVILVAVVDTGGRVVGLGLHGSRLAVATGGGSVAVYTLSSRGAEKLLAARTGLDAVDAAPTGDGGVLVCGRDGVLYLLRRDGSVADRFTPSDYDLLRGRPRRCLETLPWLVAYNDSIYFISSSGRIEEVASASNYALLGSWSRGLGAADGAAVVLEGGGRVPAAAYVSSDGSVIGVYSFIADEAVAAPTGGLGEPCQLRVGGSGWAAVIAGNGAKVAVARLPGGPGRGRPGAVKTLELPSPAAAVAWNGSSLVAVAADGGVYEAAPPAWKPRRVASLGVSLPACAASAAEPRYGLLAVAGGGKVYVLKLGGKPLPAPGRHGEEKATTSQSSTPRAAGHAAGGKTQRHATGTTTRQAAASATAEKTSGEKPPATTTSRNEEKTGSATKTAATAKTRTTTRPAGEKNETSSATAGARTGAAAETGRGTPTATEPPQEAKRSQQAGEARHATAEENAEKPTARATGNEAPRGPAGPGSGGGAGATPAALLAAAAALAALAAAKTRRSRE